MSLLTLFSHFTFLVHVLFIIDQMALNLDTVSTVFKEYLISDIITYFSKLPVASDGEMSLITGVFNK